MQPESAVPDPAAERAEHHIPDSVPDEFTDIAAYDLIPKGLRRGSVSLPAAIAIGLAATAPAYSLTGALGYGALEAGYQLPIIFAISVIPMLFVALAYRHMTAVAPDSGTVFTWGSMSIGPRVGWLGGWGLYLSSTLAGVGAAEIVVNAVATLLGASDPPLLLRVAIATCFILLTTYLVSRGAEESSRTTVVLTAIQYGGLLTLIAMMVWAVVNGHATPTAEAFSWRWLDPTAIAGFDALLGGFLVALFIFWGFDASLAMSEESTGSSRQAGWTGVISMAIILVTYVLFTVVALAYTGIDESDPASMTHPDNVDDVFRVMAESLVGRHGAVVAALIVGLSAFSATMSTVMPTARGLLAMATYRALPGRFASLDEATHTPRFATWFMGLMTLGIYVGLSLTSESVVQDSVYSVGISICAYYIVASLACVWYFRRTGGQSWHSVLGRVVLPAIAAVVLAAVMVLEAYRMTDPDYGSGSSIAGVGTTFIVGVVGMAIGGPLMWLWSRRDRAFFDGETLHRQRADWIEGEDDE